MAKAKRSAKAHAEGRKPCCCCCCCAKLHASLLHMKCCARACWRCLTSFAGLALPALIAALPALPALAVLLRRAAALLLKAAAAAASGKLLPCIACAFSAARWRMPLCSLCLLQMLSFLKLLPPAADLLRLQCAGAGKLHARVRSSSPVCINSSCRIATAVHVHVLARRWLLLASAACCRAASRGVLWCAPASKFAC